MFDTDPAFKKIPFEDDVIWQFSQEDASSQPSSEGVRVGRVRNRTTREETPATKNEDHLVKGVAFCIANGFLYASNDAEFLKEKILAFAKADGTKVLTNEKHYQAIAELITDATKTTGSFIQGFTHTEKVAELNYELFRTGKFQANEKGEIAESTSLSRMLGYFTKNRRHQAKPLDGSTLPPFEEIRSRIGFAGFYGYVETDGWYFKQFGLSPAAVKK